MGQQQRHRRDFRGDSAAASLKLAAGNRGRLLPPAFPRRFRRGLIEAIGFRQLRKQLAEFPRRFRRGLIEARRGYALPRRSLRISAAIPPRPH